MPDDTQDSTNLQAQEPQYAPVQTGPSSYSLTASNTPAEGSKVPVWGTSSVDYSPTPTGYPAEQNSPAQKYLLRPGTIDLSQRQIVDNPKDPKNPDAREYGSEYSARDKIPEGYPLAGHQMSYPTIYDGKVHPPAEAFQHALTTGQHLGIYDQSAPDKVLDEVENARHSRDIKVNGQKLNGDRWAAMKKPKPGDAQAGALFRSRNPGLARTAK